MIRRLVFWLAARLPAPRLDNSEAATREKREAVARQLRQIVNDGGAHAPRVTCGCGHTGRLLYMYRCLYCGEFYCFRCAEVHFGKPRSQYERDRTHGVAA